MPNLFNNAFASEETLKIALNKMLEPYGGGQVIVQPRTFYGKEGFQSESDEYDVTIRRQGIDSEFNAVMKAGPNQTVMMVSGEGYQFFRGDLKPISERGIGSGNEETPYYTGVESVVRRVAAAFDKFSTKYPTGQSSDETVNALFRQTAVDVPKSGFNYGGNIGILPGSPLWVSREESPEYLESLSHTYNVAITGDEAEAMRALTSAVSENPAVPLGETAPHGWSRIFGGGLGESGEYISPLAGGVPYLKPMPGSETRGAWQVAGFTPEFQKRTYVAGHRQTAEFLQVGEGGVKPIESGYIQPASFVMRPGDLPYRGIVSNALTASQAIAWQSGEMKWQLPAQLREQLSKEGAQLMAGTHTRTAIPIKNISSLSDFAKADIQLNRSLIGKTLDPGQTFSVGTWGGVNPSELEATNKQQIGSVRGYELVLGRDLLGRDRSMESHQFDLEEILGKGFDRIRFEANPGESYINVLQYSATTPGPKGGSAKGAGGFNVVSPYEFTPIGGKAFEYDVLQESKNVDALIYNAVQAMDKKTAFNFMRTLLPSQAPIIDTYQRLTQGEIPNFTELGSKLGYNNPMALISELTSKALQYRKTDQGYVPTKLNEIDPEFNQMLLDRFGIGRMFGKTSVAEYRAEMLPQIRAEQIRALASPGKDLPALSIEEATQRWEETVGKNLILDKDTGIYSFMQPMEILQHPKLQSIVPEYAGVGSDQLDFEYAMQAQRMDKIYEYLRENRSNLFSENPARKALQEIVGAHLQSTGGTVDYPNAVVLGGSGEGAIDLEALWTDMQAETVGAKPYERLQGYTRVIRQHAGMGDDVASREYYFPGQKFAFGSGDAWLEIENLAKELTDEGLTDVTQAQVSTQVNTILEQLIQNEMAGQQDPELITKALGLSGKYMNSEQLYKRKGGMFSRYTTSSLLAPHEAYVSPEWVRRNYRLMGGNVENQKEFAAYQRALKSSFGVGVRAPAPNIGTSRLPGSITPLRILTPQSRVGSLMAGAAARTGLAQPELMLSQFLGASLGDADYDPYNLLPLMYRTRRGSWNVFNPEDKNQSYNQFIKQLAANVSPEAQTETYRRLFNAYASSSSPWDEQIRESLNPLFGQAGKSLYERRMSLEFGNLSKAIEHRSQQKNEAMGSTYNVYRRRLQAAGTFLGAGEETSTRVSDLAARYYQWAIDMESKKTTFESMVGSGGFWKNNGRLSYGFYAGDEAMDNIWTAEGSSEGLTQFAMKAMAEEQGMDPYLLAEMFMTREEMPENIRGIEDSMQRERAWDDLQYEKAMQLGKELAPFMKDNMTQEDKVSLRDFIGELGKSGRVSQQSFAMQAVLTRAAEYTSQRPELMEIAKRQYGRGTFRLGNERLTFEQYVERMKPQSTLFQSLKHKSQFNYLDVFNMLDVFQRSREGGFAGSHWVQQLWHNYGESAGLPNPQDAAASYMDPFSNKRIPIQTREDLENARNIYEENMATMAQQYLAGTGSTHLSASSLGAIRNFSAGREGTDQTLRAAMLYAWRNPALRRANMFSIGSSAELDKYFQFTKPGGAADFGNVVEEAANRAITPEMAANLGYTFAPQGSGAGGSVNYNVEGPEGQLYNIGVKPDLMRVSEPEPGKFKIDITDWKNLNSLRGRSGAAIEKYINENAGYQEQIGLYQLWAGDRENYTDADRQAMLAFAEASGDPEQLAAVKNLINPEYEGQVTTTGRFAVTTFDPKQGSKGLVGKIRSGLKANLEGRTTSRAYRNVTMVNAGSNVFTPEVIANQREALGQRALEAQQVIARQALPAAHLTMAMLKQRMATNPEFIGYDLGLTADELQAQEDFKSQFGYDARLKSDVGTGALEEMYRSVYANITMLQGGRGGVAGGGGGDQGGGGTGTGTASADDEEPRRGFTPPKAKGVGAQGTVNMTSSMLKELLGAIQSRPLFGPKRLSQSYIDMQFGLASELSEQYWRQGPEGGAGPLVNVANNLQSTLAGAFGDEGIKNAIMNAGSPAAAMVMARRLAVGQGVDLKKYLQQQPELMSAIGLNATMQDAAKVAMQYRGDLSADLSNIAGDFMPIFEGIAGQGPGLEQYPTVARTAATLQSVKENMADMYVLPKGMEQLSPQQRELVTKRFEISNDQISMMDKYIERMKSYHGVIGDVNKTVEAVLEQRREAGDGQKFDRLLKKSIDYRESLVSLEEKASELAESGKLGAISGGRLSRSQIYEYLASEEGRTTAGKEAFQKYQGLEVAAKGSEFGMLREALEGGEGGGGWGGINGNILRRTIGGFGLMFMRSMFGFATQPMQYGYQEGLQQDQAYERALGPIYGGMGDVGNVENRIAQLKAANGALGWGNIRNLQADVMQNQPGLASLANYATAGLGGAGLAGWLGGMMLPASTPLAPLMIGVGALAGGAAFAGNYLGARSDPTGNAANIARLVNSGQLNIGSIGGANGAVAVSNLNPGNVLSTAFNPDYWSYMYSWANSALGARDETTGKLPAEDAERLKYVAAMTNIKNYSAFGYKGQREFLEGIGYTSPQASGMLADYAQSILVNAGSTVSPEAGAAAAGALGYYNLSFNENNLPRLAEFYQQGINPQQIAQMIVSSPMTGMQQQYAGASNLLNQFSYGTKQMLTAREIEQLTAGTQRFESLGLLAPNLSSQELNWGGTTYNQMQAYKQRLGEMGAAQWQAFGGRAQIEQGNLALGLGGTLPSMSDFENMNQTQLVAEMQLQQQQQRELQLRQQLAGAYQGAGFTNITDMMAQTMGQTMAELQAQYTQAQSALGIGQNLIQGGTSADKAQQLVQRLQTQLTPQQFERFQRITNFEPMAIAQVMQNMSPMQQQLAGMTTIPTGQGFNIPLNLLAQTDTTLGGQLTGLPWGTSSLNMGTWSGQDVAQQIWGSDFSKWGEGGQGLIQAALGNGPTTLLGQQVGGMRGIQLYQMQLQAEQQQAQVGNQLAQLNLGYAFTTGVGLGNYAGIINPQTGQPFNINTGSGGFWGIEDRNRQLGYAQTQYSYDMQQRQMDMNNRFFNQNFSLNYQQAMMQRDWAREDWTTSDITRNLQWGWKQEDFQENVRFMTGRDRRLAERQMRRETTMHDIEGGQIDKQRERQEELWTLEDKRYDIQLDQHNESLKLQQEQLDKNREFFEERKRIDEESRELQRAYWTEQQRLQKEAAGTAAYYAEKNREVQVAMLALTQYMEDNKAAVNSLTKDALYPLLEALGLTAEEIKKVIDALGGGSGSSGSSGSTGTWGTGEPEDVEVPNEPSLPPHSLPPEGFAIGGDYTAGKLASVNEIEAEFFRSNQSGQIIPLSKLNPWNQTSVVLDQSRNENGQIKLVINIGNNVFRTYIVDLVDQEINDG